MDTYNKEKVLEIEKNTNVFFLKNKQDYSKLILHKPVKLNQFPNVKEAIIKYQIVNNILALNNVEKIRFYNNYSLGFETICQEHRVFKAPASLKANKLKSIEISSHTQVIQQDFLEKSTNIEEIIFNIKKTNKLHFAFDNDCNYITYLSTRNTKLKKIIIKCDGKSFQVDLDYIPHKINKLEFIEKTGEIVLEFENDLIKSVCSIKNDEINTKNILHTINDDMASLGMLYIPDYITDVDIEKKLSTRKIDEIMFNSSKLSSFYCSKEIINLNDINILDVRNNNDMALFKSKKFFSKDYGKLKNILASSNNVLLEYENRTIEIDKYGNTKEINNKNEKAQNVDDILISDCTSEQLKYYMYFKEILELFKNEDDIDDNLITSLTTVEKALVKHFNKREGE